MYFYLCLRFTVECCSLTCRSVILFNWWLFVFSFFLLTPDLFIPLPFLYRERVSLSWATTILKVPRFNAKYLANSREKIGLYYTVFLSSPHICTMNRDRIRDVFFESVVYLLLVMLWCCFCCEQHHILMAPSKRKTPAYNSLIIIAHDAYRQSLPQQTCTAQRTHTQFSVFLNNFVDFNGIFSLSLYFLHVVDTLSMRNGIQSILIFIVSFSNS